MRGWYSTAVTHVSARKSRFSPRCFVICSRLRDWTTVIQQSSLGIFIGMSESACGFSYKSVPLPGKQLLDNWDCNSSGENIRMHEVTAVQTMLMHLGQNGQFLESWPVPRVNIAFNTFVMVPDLMMYLRP